MSEDMGVKECDVMDPYPVRTGGGGKGLTSTGRGRFVRGLPRMGCVRGCDPST